MTASVACRQGKQRVKRDRAMLMMLETASGKENERKKKKKPGAR